MGEDNSRIRITINGRQYEVAVPFSNRELHTIKQITGARAGEMPAALEAGDNDMLVALAHIAVKRSGATRPTLDELWDMAAGEIQADDPDDVADPPKAEANGSPETTPPPDGSPPTVESTT